MRPKAKYGQTGEIRGHWLLLEYKRRGEWDGECICCHHVQLVRIDDVYLPRCRECGRSSSYQRPSHRAKYLSSSSR